VWLCLQVCQSKVAEAADISVVGMYEVQVGVKRQTVLKSWKEELCFTLNQQAPQLSLCSIRRMYLDPDFVLSYSSLPYVVDFPVVKLVVVCFII